MATPSADPEAFTRAVLEDEAPSHASDEIVQRWAAFFRASASPGAVLAIERMQSEIDARPILPTISVPTLAMRPSRRVHRGPGDLGEVSR